MQSTSPLQASAHHGFKNAMETCHTNYNFMIIKSYTFVIFSSVIYLFMPHAVQWCIQKSRNRGHN